ncbi:MAG: SlyX family protein [Succinivibrio sp.]|nr:SlyX family protein [Succinivibrio sp.]
MNNDKMITLLEEKIAWLEQQLDEQGQELSRIQREFTALSTQFKQLYQKISDPYAVRSLKDEVPPPHY